VSVKGVKNAKYKEGVGGEVGIRGVEFGKGVAYAWVFVRAEEGVKSVCGVCESVGVSGGRCRQSEGMLVGDGRVKIAKYEG